MKLIVLVLTAIVFSLQGHAQYTFSQLNSAYMEIGVPDTVLAASGWDDDEYVVDLGFQVSAYGRDYSHITIESNGSILLHNGITGSVFLSTDTFPTFMPFGEFISYDGYLDLKSRSGGSPVSYTVTGTAPNRIGVVQFKNAGFFDDASGNDFINFQLFISEISGDVEFRYGSSMVSTSSYGGVSGATLGIAKFVPFSYSLIDGLYLTDSAHAPVVSNTYDYITGTPAGTQIYRFVNDLTTSIPEQPSSRPHIYPNPASGSFQIDVRFNEAELVLRDMTGRMVLEQRLQGSGQHAVDIAGLGAGVYFVMINGTTAGKLVVK